MGNATLVEGNRVGPPCGGGDYADRGRAMLLIAEPADAAAGERGIAAAGGRLLRRVGWDGAAAALRDVATIPVVAIEARGRSPEALAAALPGLVGHLPADVPVVVALRRAQIDGVAVHLFGPGVTLLCDPDDAMLARALADVARPVRPVLHAPLPDTVQSERPHFGHAGDDDDRLRRLTEAMAHISRYAADLSRGIPSAEIADRRRGFESEPVAPVTQMTRAQEVRRMIARRRQRGKFFGQFGGEALFEDPAWDMLLDLYAAELEGTRVSVSSLCIAAGVAPTTALRWIAKMSEMELFVRDPDPVDRRRAFMTLSPRASEAMRGYMAAVRKMESGGA